MRRRDFILSVSGMWILALVSGFESERIAFERSLTGEKVDVEMLKREAERGNISLKEAMFYEAVGKENGKV